MLLRSGLLLCSYQVCLSAATHICTCYLIRLALALVDGKITLRAAISPLCMQRNQNQVSGAVRCVDHSGHNVCPFTALHRSPSGAHIEPTYHAVRCGWQESAVYAADAIKGTESKSMHVTAIIHTILDA